MDPRVVYTAETNTEAEILKGWLEQQGIKASIFNGEMSSGAFEIIETDPQVLVHVDDYDRAVDVVETFVEEMANQPDLSDMSDAEGQFDWPMCPVCDALRLARCGGCQQNSNEFSNLDTSSGNTAFCPRCDAVHPIEFLDHCEYCQHDFTGSTPEQISMSDVESTNVNRVVILIAGMVLLVLIIAVWMLFFMK